MLKVFFLGLLPFVAFGQAPPSDIGDARHPNESLDSFSNILQAAAVVADRPLYEAVLIIDQTPRPEDNGGNVFLAGFLEIDENGYPGTGLVPSDFQQLGVWIQSWPYRREVQLVAGLHYYIQYGYNEMPDIRDRVSTAFSVNSPPTEPIQVDVSIDTPFDSPNGQGPMRVGRDPSLAASSVDGVLTVTFEPPPEELGGSIFLTGFSEVDGVSGMPERGSTPIDFSTATINLDSANFEAEITLIPGLHYFAMYGHGDHPGPEERMSLGALFAEGDTTLTLNIGDLTTPPEGDDGDSRGAPLDTRVESGNTENGASMLPQAAAPMIMEMARSHVKKWASIALLGGIFIGGFIGWFLRGRVR